ncbi:uncharacterized protein LOC117601369 isoform X2 [Osmia lignaria lignaria]|uniref:uncharacterized protein LOC117601369 isoform X2 n=1 Tax=Osmia lignaria lignaria TaxID=1437193 RepID=UPI00402BD28F
MASVAEFIPDPIDLEEDIKRRDDLAESTRREKYIAARKIQAWIRGILTRNHLRLLHKSAIIVQRHWRGHRTRVAVDLYLVEHVHQLWQNYYDEMATRIQAIWRGYWVRKTVLDIPKMRRWLKSVYAKNQETVENMRKFRYDVIKYEEAVMEHESMQCILFILFKLHHLLRTHERPGVITRIDKTRFTFIEQMLKCFEYRRYAGRKRRTCRDCQIDRKPTLLLQGTYYERPYEEDEKIQRKWNQLDLEASIHEKYLRNSTCNIEMKEVQKKDSCNLKIEIPCTGAKDLYKEIEKMDCHLNQLRLRCPIHEPSSSCSTTKGKH